RVAAALAWVAYAAVARGPASGAAGARPRQSGASARSAARRLWPRAAATGAIRARPSGAVLRPVRARPPAARGPGARLPGARGPAAWFGTPARVSARPRCLALAPGAPAASRSAAARAGQPPGRAHVAARTLPPAVTPGFTRAGLRGPAAGR